MVTIDEGLFRAVGRTPTVRLDRVFAGAPFELYAKLEMLNPGGSSKDRPALAMLRAAIREGRAGAGTTVIESSSGNLGISLAQLCNRFGMPFICVVDPKTTQANLRLLQLYGARIEMVRQADPATGEYLPARLARVKELLAAIPGSYWPNQYGNAHNSRAHREGTMPELIAAVGRVDVLFVGVSTCGMLRGCLDYVREQGLYTRVVAVDAAGSAVFGTDAADGGGRKRRLPGLGAAVVPPLRPETGVKDVVTVDDQDCVAGCRLLVRRESILAGASAGGLIAAVARYRQRIPDEAVCAVILPDRGERYLDTVYSDEWVQRELGPLALQEPDWFPADISPPAAWHGSGVTGGGSAEAEFGSGVTGGKYAAANGGAEARASSGDGAGNGGTEARVSSAGGSGDGGTEARASSAGGSGDGGTNARVSSAGGSGDGGTNARVSSAGGAGNGGTNARVSSAGGSGDGGGPWIHVSGGADNEVMRTATDARSDPGEDKDNEITGRWALP